MGPSPGLPQESAFCYVAAVTNLTAILTVALVLTSCAGADDRDAVPAADTGSLPDAASDAIPSFQQDTHDTQTAAASDAPAFDPAACDLRFTYTRPEGGLPSPLAMDPKGRVYAAGAGRLHSIRPDGSFEWTWPDDPSELTSPSEQLYAPSLNGYGTTVLVGGESGRLYAITHLGGTKWVYDAGSPVRVAPASAEPALPGVPQGGLVFIVTDDGRLHVLRDDGSNATLLHDTLDVGTPGASAPGIAVLDDATVRVRTETRLVAAAAGGAELWSWDAEEGATLLAGPAVAKDGTLRVALGRVPVGAGRFDQVTVATFDDGGVAIIERDLGLSADTVRGMAFDDDDRLLVTTATRLQAWSPGGELLWRVFGEATPSTAPAAAEGGLSVYGAAPHSLVVIDLNGQLHWQLDTEGTLASGAPLVSADGTIYAHLGSTVVSIHCGSPGPARSRWPRYQGNAASSGRPTPLAVE